MVIDNGEIVATGEAVAAKPPGVSGSEVITVSGAIGSGVGASIALSSGTITGAAFIPVLAAGFAGVGATAYASWSLGTAIGETDIVRDNILKLIEAVMPNDTVSTPPEVWENDGGFEVVFGTERFEVDFYVDALGMEGTSMDADFNAGLEYFDSPFDAAYAAEQLDIVGHYNPYVDTAAAGMQVAPVVLL
ncbi:MAG: hypothetical protein V4631_21825 [Pseudomonadota bacterium]